MPVADWEHTTLSNISTLVKWEQEIQELCGYRIRKAYIYLGENPAIRTEYLPPTFPPDIERSFGLLDYSYANVVTANGDKYSCDLSERLNPMLPYWLTQKDELIKFEFGIKAKIMGGVELLLVGVIDFTNPLNFDKDEFIVSTDITDIVAGKEDVSGLANYHPTIRILFRGCVWRDIETVSDKWQDKIDMAKQILILDLEKLLRDNNYEVDYESGQKLINVINNPNDFVMACDFKALQLIYEDLMESSLNSEIYERKSQKYKEKYRDELYQAWLRANLDPDLSGNIYVYKPDIIGELER